MGDVQQFVTGFEAEFGRTHPHFLTCSYSQVRLRRGQWDHPYRGVLPLSLVGPGAGQTGAEVPVGVPPFSWAPGHCGVLHVSV